MLETARSPAPRALCTTAWSGEDTLETRFAGHVSAAAAEQGRADAFELIGERRVAYWIVDTSAITGFDAGVHKPGVAWMRGFREHGGVRMLVVFNLVPVRMMAAAMAFASGMPMTAVASRDAALEIIRTTRSELGTTGR